LIAEDDADLAEITRLRLSRAGFLTETAHNLSQMPGLLENHTFDIILMNSVMPEREGEPSSEEMCRSIRGRCRCPIIFLCGAEDNGTIQNMISAGADDYMVKPVRYDELILRIKARIQQVRLYPDRATPNWSGSLIRLKRLIIDLRQRRVTAGDEEISLSPIEFSLLTYMAQRQGSLLLYEDLYRHVWDADCLGDTRTIMVHISNLRKKVDPDHAGLIETVRGAGYIFSDA
jgi:DNA-binding response OmpR family regulator